MKSSRHWLLCGLVLPILFNAPGAHASAWVEDLESPVRTPARWVLLGGTGLTLVVLATQDAIANPFEKQTMDEKPLGSFSKYGDWMGQLVPNALYLGGMGIAYYFHQPLAYGRGKLMLEATVYAALVTTVLKYSVREPRPQNRDHFSFPSGHATTAFAFAGVVAAEHGWWYGVPAMGLATFVAYSRINDGQHHLQDVVAGATIGLSCAYGIYYSHQNERSQALADFQLLPVVLPGGAEVAATWRY